jgi:protein-arginine deiminase
MSGDEFQGEFGDWRVVATLQVKDLVNGDSFEVQLTGSPLLLNHHLQRSVLTSMVAVNYSGYENSSMVSQYGDVLGDAFLSVNGQNYGGDVWLQDELEFANAVGTDGHMGVVMDLIRDRGLADVAEEQFVGPNMMRGVWGSGQGTSQDYGGNIEVAPPTPEYPMGRIYYGAQGRYAPADEVEELFESQAVQAPFELDSSWLCVGHVDEWFTTIPFEGSRLGWKLVYSSDEMAWDALESMDPDTNLSRFTRDKAWDTPREILADAQLRALNDTLTRDVLEPQLQILIDELDLQEEDILYIPGLFETVSQCGGAVAALFPGMANLIVADDLSGQTTLFVPDPMVRTNVNDTSSDPVIDAFVAEMPPELRLEFMDDWQVYHMQLGEVHCGSNVVRAPYDGADWWNEGWSLMEESK